MSVEESAFFGGGWAIELGDLTVAVVLERGAQALEEIGAAEGALGVAEVLAEVIGERAVVAAGDEGVGGGLVVAAAGEQGVVGRVRGAQETGRGEVVVFVEVTAEDVDGRRQEPGSEGVLGRESGEGGDFAGASARVATVQEDIEPDVLGEFREEGFEVVVDNVSAVPVHVVRAEDFVESIFEFVAVAVADLGAVAGEVEEEAVAGFGVFDEPSEAGEDGLLSGAAIDEDTDLFDGEAEVLEEDVAEIGDVVDAALEVGSGELVTVHADEEGFVGHGGWGLLVISYRFSGGIGDRGGKGSEK